MITLGPVPLRRFGHSRGINNIPQGLLLCLLPAGPHAAAGNRTPGILRAIYPRHIKDMAGGGLRETIDLFLSW